MENEDKDLAKKVEQTEDLIDLNLDENLSFNKKFNSYAKRVFNKRDIFLFPNILCYFRILVAIVYLIIYLWPYDFVSGQLLDDSNFLFNSTLCGLLLLVCGYTDFVDGFIARKFNMQSHLGKIFKLLPIRLLILLWLNLTMDLLLV